MYKPWFGGPDSNSKYRVVMGEIFWFLKCLSLTFNLNDLRNQILCFLTEFCETKSVEKHDILQEDFTENWLPYSQRLHAFKHSQIRFSISILISTNFIPVKNSFDQYTIHLDQQIFKPINAWANKHLDQQTFGLKEIWANKHLDQQTFGPINIWAKRNWTYKHLDQHKFGRKNIWAKRNLGL